MVAVESSLVFTVQLPRRRLLPLRRPPYPSVDVSSTAAIEMLADAMVGDVADFCAGASVMLRVLVLVLVLVGGFVGVLRRGFECACCGN